MSLIRIPFAISSALGTVADPSSVAAQQFHLAPGKRAFKAGKASFVFAEGSVVISPFFSLTCYELRRNSGTEKVGSKRSLQPASKTEKAGREVVIPFAPVARQKIRLPEGSRVNWKLNLEAGHGLLVSTR